MRNAAKLVSMISNEGFLNGRRYALREVGLLIDNLVVIFLCFSKTCQLLITNRHFSLFTTTKNTQNTQKRQNQSKEDVFPNISRTQVAEIDLDLQTCPSVFPVYLAQIRSAVSEISAENPVFVPTTLTFV